jgi:hypothetical protein
MEKICYIKKVRYSPPLFRLNTGFSCFYLETIMKQRLILTLSILFLFGFATACDDDSNNNNNDECNAGDTQNGTTTCGVNDEGVFTQECTDGLWTDTENCTGNDECVNDATQLGTVSCNTDGFLYQDCTLGEWVDSANCSTGGCVADATQIGTAACGLNAEGYFVQLCDADGNWGNTAECTGTDICTNGENQDGTTVCNETGVFIQDCTLGEWIDSANCTVGGCTEDATQIGTTVCGLNDEGFLVELCDANGDWNEITPDDCTGTHECTNDATQVGTTVCNITGYLEQDCTLGSWVDSADCTVEAACTQDATQVGDATCGLNNEGYLVEICDSGVWSNISPDDCTGTDICTNDNVMTGTDTCGDGNGIFDDICTAGAWANDVCVCNANYNWNGTTCADDVVVEWCDVVANSPGDYTGTVDATEIIYGQIYGEVNSTQVTGSGTENPSINAQVCYADNGTDVCVNSVYNTVCPTCGNNDEYMGELVFDATGAYTYFYKFSGDMGATWTTCASTFTATIEEAITTPVFPPNGDFESWTAGLPDFWTTIDSGLVVTEETTTTHGGSGSSISIGNTQSNNSSTDFFQDVIVLPSTTYDISAWVFHPAGSLVKFTLVFGGSSLTYGSSSVIATTGVWQQVTDTYDTGAAETTIQVGFRSYDQNGFTPGEVYFVDDYTVTPQ